MQCKQQVLLFVVLQISLQDVANVERVHDGAMTDEHGRACLSRTEENSEAPPLTAHCNEVLKKKRRKALEKKKGLHARAYNPFSLAANSWCR
jgi:hypothetical protein